MKIKGRNTSIVLRVILAIILTGAVAYGVNASFNYLGFGNNRPGSVDVYSSDSSFDTAAIKSAIAKTRWDNTQKVVVYIGKTPQPKVKTMAYPNLNDFDTHDDKFYDRMLSNFFMMYPQYGYFKPNPGVVVFYVDTEKNYCTIDDGNFGKQFEDDGGYVGSPQGDKGLVWSVFKNECIAKSLNTQSLIEIVDAYAKSSAPGGYNISFWRYVFTIGITLLILPLIIFISTIGMFKSKKEPGKKRFAITAFNNRAVFGVISVLVLIPVFLAYNIGFLMAFKTDKLPDFNDIYAAAPTYLKDASYELAGKGSHKLVKPAKVEVIDKAEILKNDKDLQTAISKLGFTKKVTVTVLTVPYTPASGPHTLKNKDRIYIEAARKFPQYVHWDHDKLVSKNNGVVLLYFPCPAEDNYDCQIPSNRFLFVGGPWDDLVKHYPLGDNNVDISDNKAQQFFNYRTFIEVANLSVMSHPVIERNENLDRAVWETLVGLANTERNVYRVDSQQPWQISTICNLFSGGLLVGFIIFIVLLVFFIYWNEDREWNYVVIKHEVEKNEQAHRRQLGTDTKEDSQDEAVSSVHTPRFEITKKHFVTGFVAVAVVLFFVGASTYVKKVDTNLSWNPTTVVKTSEEKYPAGKVIIDDKDKLLDDEAVRTAILKSRYPLPFDVTVIARKCENKNCVDYPNIDADNHEIEATDIPALLDDNYWVYILDPTTRPEDDLSSYFDQATASNQLSTPYTYLPNKPLLQVEINPKIIRVISNLGDDVYSTVTDHSERELSGNDMTSNVLKVFNDKQGTIVWEHKKLASDINGR